MNSSFTQKVKTVFSSRIWYYIENLIVVGLFFYCIKSLIDYDNVYYQTWKNEAASKAILAFTAIVFIIRKVKLLNWQSLVATLLFGAVVFERMHFWADAEDILNAVKPQLAAEWLSLMIIIDMILYKNVNNLFKGVNHLAILYILMTIGMIWRRHDRMDPIVLLFPMLLFALVKMDEEKEEWFMHRFIDGWFISFNYVMVKSFSEHPYEGFRYYGCFLNIGQFGIFMICCFTVSIAALCNIKKSFKKTNWIFYVNILWLITICYMLYIIDTRTILAGLIFCCVVLFIYVRKDTSKRAILKRKRIILLTSIIAFALCLILMKVSNLISEDWYLENYIGPLSPVVHILTKFRAMGTVEFEGNILQLLFDRIDQFSSKRLSIAKEYSQLFNYEGNGSVGLFIEKYNYWAYSAHNTYLQFLIEYGYISFCEIILIIILSFNNLKRKFIQNKNRLANIVPLLWIASMLGVWLGESNTLFYPVTFWGWLFIANSIHSPLEEIR